MSTYENTATKPDVYQRVTDAIVNAIESGIGQYHMPWTVRRDKGFSRVSVGSAKPYRGINTQVLWAQSQSKGYSSALLALNSEIGDRQGQAPTYGGLAAA